MRLLPPVFSKKRSFSRSTRLLKPFLTANRSTSARIMTKSTTDYASWEHRDLVQRVHDLERKLRQQNFLASSSAVPIASRNDKKQKEKKPGKAFDPTRYSTRKIALKFAYLGSAYNGLEYHANNVTPLPAVEEILWRALMKTRLIFPQHKSGQSLDEVCWDGCEYSKCGRTDKGVSAFGQVVGLRVRSARRLQKSTKDDTSIVPADQDAASTEPQPDEEAAETRPFDPVADELPYAQLLNKVLPDDIRVLAWCSDMPQDFDARFSCRERRYRYFFTNPAYLPAPGGDEGTDGWLDIGAMQNAAKKYEGLHDFRNFCKIDPSKQITNFERRIFHAGIHAVKPADSLSPTLYYFEVRGSAFLWHQVRHLVAVLFLVGQGFEAPTLIDELLDVKKTPSKPLYEMADDTPLVLWDCVFPSVETTSDHSYNAQNHSYEDSLPWIHAKSADGGKSGPNGMMDSMWSFWRERKMDEILANQLLGVVAKQGHASSAEPPASTQSARVFEGGHRPRNVGPYTPVLQRARMETAEVLNARYAAKKAATQIS